MNPFKNVSQSTQDRIALSREIADSHLPTDTKKELDYMIFDTNTAFSPHSVRRQKVVEKYSLATINSLKKRSAMFVYMFSLVFVSQIPYLTAFWAAISGYMFGKVLFSVRDYYNASDRVPFKMPKLFYKK